MNYQTPCNRCNYSRITKEAGEAGQDVELLPKDGLLAVYVDDKWKASFMELPDRCCCGAEQ